MIDPIVLAVWALVAMVACFPQDAADLVDLAWTYLRMIGINLELFVRAYALYYSIKKERAKLGLATPPFHFTPTWNRADQ